MKITALLSRIRPLSLFPAHLLGQGEVLTGAIIAGLDAAPPVDIHQEGFYALCSAIVAAPQGGRTAEQMAQDQGLFSALADGVRSYCGRSGISTYSGIPATEAQACVAGLRLARHLRDVGQPALAAAVSAGVAYAQDRAFPGSYRLALFDARMDFSQRPPRPLAAAQAANDAIIASGLVLGFEVSDPGLAGRLDGNLDLQHTGASTRGVVPLCPGADASWSATRWAEGLIRMGWHLPGGSTLVGYRADLDALTAMALLTQGFTAEELDLSAIRSRLDAVDASDNFKTSGPWSPQRPFTPDAPWGYVGDSSVSEVGHLVAANAVAQDATIPLARRVAVVAYWLRHGEAFSGGPAELAAARKKVEADRRALLASVCPTVRDGIGVVQTHYPGAFSIIYRVAPVGLATNPAFRGIGAQQWAVPGTKHTIAGWGGSWISTKFNALVAALNAADPVAGPGNTWGGNPASGIIGSPNGGPSGLTQEQVLQIMLQVRTA